jgi:hypothetical protein
MGKRFSFTFDGISASRLQAEWGEPWRQSEKSMNQEAIDL